MLEFLRELRDAAQSLCDIATGRVTPESPEPVADPVKQQAFEDAQAAYDAALAQSVADGTAAIEALLFQHAPSELPPCDSEELRMNLDQLFCTGAVVSPFTPEDEEMFPGGERAIRRLYRQDVRSRRRL